MNLIALKLAVCLPIIAVLTLSACRRPDADQPSAMTPEARQRTVPIVRPLKLVPMEHPLVVEFDAPDPSPNAMPELAVAVRVRESGSFSSRDIRDQIRRLGLEAEIHLTRVEGGQELPVRLARFDPRSDAAPTAVEAGQDGRVPGAEPYTVDISSLIDAGIVKAHEQVRTLAFAWAPGAEAGTYRLSFRLINPPESLRHIDADLLVAYQFRPK